MSVKSLDRFVESTPDCMNGKPCLTGRRIRVSDVAIWHEAMKMDVQTISSEFDLSPAEIHAALAYYFDHREEIEAEIASDERFSEEMKQKHPSLLAEKLSKPA